MFFGLLSLVIGAVVGGAVGGTAAARKNGGGGIVTVRYERDVLLAVAVDFYA